MEIPNLEAKVARRENLVARLEHLVALEQLRGTTITHSRINARSTQSERRRQQQLERERRIEAKARKRARKRRAHEELRRQQLIHRQQNRDRLNSHASDSNNHEAASPRQRRANTIDSIDWENISVSSASTAAGQKSPRSGSPEQDHLGAPDRNNSEDFRRGGKFSFRQLFRMSKTHENSENSQARSNRPSLQGAATTVAARAGNLVPGIIITAEEIETVRACEEELANLTREIELMRNKILRSNDRLRSQLKRQDGVSSPGRNGGKLSLSDLLGQVDKNENTSNGLSRNGAGLSRPLCLQQNHRTFSNETNTSLQSVPRAGGLHAVPEDVPLESSPGHLGSPTDDICSNGDGWVIEPTLSNDETVGSGGGGVASLFSTILFGSSMSDFEKSLPQLPTLDIDDDAAVLVPRVEGTAAGESGDGSDFLRCSSDEHLNGECQDASFDNDKECEPLYEGRRDDGIATKRTPEVNVELAELEDATKFGDDVRMNPADHYKSAAVAQEPNQGSDPVLTADDGTSVVKKVSAIPPRPSLAEPSLPRNLNRSRQSTVSFAPTNSSSDGFESGTESTRNAVLRGSRFATKSITTGTVEVTSSLLMGSREIGNAVKNVVQEIQPQNLVGAVRNTGAQTFLKAKEVGTTLVDTAAFLVPVSVAKREGIPRDAGFVIFSKLYSKGAAMQMKHHRDPYVMEVHEAPDNLDVFWRNVGMSVKNRRTGLLISAALTAVLCFFWSFPMALIASLTELNSLKEELPKIGEAIENHPRLEPLFALVAPLFLLFFNDVILPSLLKYISAFEGFIANALLEASLFQKLGVFMVRQCFAGSLQVQSSTSVVLLTFVRFP
jgi:Calcium-dependent channel, 7TM region, putative phosphate